MYTETLWKEWLQHELKNYKNVSGRRKFLKKGYAHFDHRIWLPTQQATLHNLLKNQLKEFNSQTRRWQRHSFTPFLKILIKTPRYRYQETEGSFDLECKIRPICFASHFDSLIFGFYSYGLNKLYQNYINEKKFQESVLAYRTDTGKCNIQYTKEVFDQIKVLNQVHGGCTAIALDIKGYFDHIDHTILLDKWVKVLG
ncbi:MAG TPA: hypothetical protein VFV08_08050, partial [Puia sp.]|nr:hypothetical protein [Puia sp.]